VVVGLGVEFATGPEFQHSDFDVVPVQVEIGPTRNEFTYSDFEGGFHDAAFNGYVLQFEVDCALFQSARIDEGATTMRVTLDDIRTEGGALFVNGAGRSYGPDVTLALDFAVDERLLGQARSQTARRSASRLPHRCLRQFCPLRIVGHSVKAAPGRLRQHVTDCGQTIVLWARCPQGRPDQSTGTLRTDLGDLTHGHGARLQITPRELRPQRRIRRKTGAPVHPHHGI